MSEFWLKPQELILTCSHSSRRYVAFGQTYYRGRIVGPYDTFVFTTNSCGLFLEDSGFGVEKFENGKVARYVVDFLV